MRLTGLFFILTVWSLLPAPAGAENGERRVIFIFDASGSMKAKLGNQSRIAVAKDVMTQLLRDVPSGVEFGVLAYGHRRKDDCDDIETIVPVGAMSKEKAIATIQKLQPIGKTPITSSVRKAAQTLGVSRGPSTIILVSDGEETCGADPCAAVRELRKGDVSFTLHVVGFGVTTREAKQLECIATEGGGTYSTASTARELLDALRKVERAENPSGELAITVRKRGQLVDASLSISRAGGKRVEGGWSGTKEPVVYRLLPGVYDIAVTDTSVSGSKDVLARDVEVRIGERTVRNIDLDVEGRAAISAIKSGKRFAAEFGVVRLPERSRVHGGWLSAQGPSTMDLLPGLYEVVAKDTNVSAQPTRSQTFEVKASETVTVDLDFASEGRAAVSAWKDGKRIPAEVRVIRLSDKKSVHGGWLSTSGPVAINLLPGAYEAAALDTKMATKSEQRSPFEVVAGETAVVDIQGFEEARADISAFSGGKRQGCEFSLNHREGKGRDSGWLSKDGPRTSWVLPGTYDLTVRCGNEKKKVEGITLKHGEHKTFEVPF